MGRDRVLSWTVGLLLSVALTVAKADDSHLSSTSVPSDSLLLADLFKVTPVRNDCSRHDEAGDAYGPRCAKWHVHWKMSSEQIARARFSSFSPSSDTACTRVFAVQTLPAAQDSVLVLLETTLPELDCPPCAPQVSLALYARQKALWQRCLYQPVLTNAGSFGTIGAAPQLAALGGARFALIFQHGSTGQGSTETGVTVFVNGPTEFHQALSIPTGASNRGSCGTQEQCWSYSSKISFTKGKDRAYNDLLVTTTGTKLVHGQLTAVNEQKTYLFDGTRFIAP